MSKKYDSLSSYCHAIGEGVLNTFFETKVNALAVEYMMIDLFGESMIYMMSNASTIEDKKNMLLNCMYIKGMRTKEAREFFTKRFNQIVDIKKSQEVKLQLAEYKDGMTKERKRVFKTFEARLENAIYYRMPIKIERTEFRYDQLTVHGTREAATEVSVLNMIPTEKAFLNDVVVIKLLELNKVFIFNEPTEYIVFDLKKCTDYEINMPFRCHIGEVRQNVGRWNVDFKCDKIVFRFEKKHIEYAKSVHKGLSMLASMLKKSSVFMPNGIIEDFSDFLRLHWNHARHHIDYEPEPFVWEDDEADFNQPIVKKAKIIDLSE